MVTIARGPGSDSPSAETASAIPASMLAYPYQSTARDSRPPGRARGSASWSSLDPRRRIDAPLDGSPEPTLPAVRSGDQGRRRAEDGDCARRTGSRRAPRNGSSGVDVRPSLPIELVRPRVARRAASRFLDGWQRRQLRSGRRPLLLRISALSTIGRLSRRIAACWRGRDRRARGVPRARARPRAAGSANRAARRRPALEVTEPDCDER